MLRLVTDAIMDLSTRGILPLDLSTRTLGATTRIDELGLDSLGKLDLLSELEDRANVTLSESMLPGLGTLGEIASLLDRLSS